MNSRSPRLRRLRKLATCVLVLGMIFQWGACPCGCLEHNAWLELCGVDHDDQGDTLAGSPVSETAPSVSDAEGHDCTGKPRPHYVDNSRSPEQIVRAFDLLEAVAAVSDVASGQTIAKSSGTHAGHDASWVACAPSRPALQVYRL